MSARRTTTLIILILLLVIAVLMMNRTRQHYEQEMHHYQKLYQQADSTIKALQQQYNSLRKTNIRLKQQEITLRWQAASSDTVIHQKKKSYADTYHHIDTFGAAEVQRFFTGYFARTDTL